MGRDAGAIRTPDQRLRVFVSSTLKELATERRAVRAAIERLAMAPVMFELGARPHPPRSLYRAYLEQSDIFVGIYGEQYGWVAPGEHVSGLEDEWNLSPGMPRLVYFKRTEHRHPRLESLLARIRADDEASYVEFTDAKELGRLVTGDLATLLAERFENVEPRRSGPLSEPASEVASTEAVGLPSPLTAMLGRDEELHAAVRMLATDGARLVTITGPGGIGKTRLAIAAAREVEGFFADGTVFVDLAPVHDPDAVIPALAQALGVRDIGDAPIADKLDLALAHRDLLVVLDNCEQVIEAAPRISALLASSTVSVLATSRVLLRISGEQSVELGPLSESDGARLFLQRARAVKPGLEWVENERAITAIANALDRTPLAIELAAARIRMFTPAEILARLDHSLALLVDGPRDVPVRQRAMRATIEWSTRLLQDEHRALLHRLGVFPSGFALDAVEWMADGIPGIDALEALAALVDGSLVLERDRGDRAWYTLLTTVREYAREQLDLDRELDACLERHARFFLALAGQASGPLMHSGQGDWMSRLVDERDGLRTAVTHFLATHQWEEVVQTVWPLTPFWWIGGQMGEVAAWMDRLLEPDVQLDRHSTTIAMFLATTVAVQQAPDASYIPALEECVTRFEEEADHFGEAAALASLGMAQLLQPDPTIDEAEQNLQRSVALMDEADNPFFRATVGLILGQLELMRGRIPAARAQFEAIYELARAHEDAVSQSGALNYLGWVSLLTGDMAAAREYFEETLLLTISTGSEWGSAYAMDGLSALAATSGDLAGAGRLLGAAEGIRERKGIFAASTDMFYQPILQRILEGPGAELFESARHAGRDDGIAEIAESALRPRSPSSPGETVARPAVDGAEGSATPASAFD